MNLDLIAFTQFECLDHGGRQPDREAVSPFCDLHSNSYSPDIRVVICISNRDAHQIKFQFFAMLDVHDMFYSIMDRSASADTRLFLAILPDAAAALCISRLAASLKRAHGLSGTPIALDRLHVSLFFLGRLPGDASYAARAEDGELPIAPFEVRFDRTASFRGRPGSRPFVLIGGDGVSQLKSFRRRLATWLAGNGFKRLAKTNFEPHVTLLYDSCGVDEYPLAEPVCWTVREIVLIQSRLGHTHLAKWRLCA